MTTWLHGQRPSERVCQPPLLSPSDPPFSALFTLEYQGHNRPVLVQLAPNLVLPGTPHSG